VVYNTSTDPMESQPHNKETPETPESESDEHKEGLASLLGKYNDDPRWQEFQENMEKFRREIDDFNKE